MRCRTPTSFCACRVRFPAASACGVIGSVTFPISCALPRTRAACKVLGGIAVRQRTAVADAHHLRAAFLVVSFQPRQVLQVFRIGRIGEVEDRRPLNSAIPAILLIGFGTSGVPPWCRYRQCSARPVYGWSADRRCALQVALAYEAHVGGLWRIADFGRLRESGAEHQGRQRNREPASHGFPQMFVVGEILTRHGRACPGHPA